MKKLLILIFFTTCFACFSQEAKTSQPDQLPEFPGGGDAMMKYISTHLKFPESALKDSTFDWCKAIIKFTIETDGTVKNPVLVRECLRCQDCDREAIRVIESMPKWKPGTKDGKPTAMQHALPVFFSRKP